MAITVMVSLDIINFYTQGSICFWIEHFLSRKKLLKNKYQIPRSNARVRDERTRVSEVCPSPHPFPGFSDMCVSEPVSVSEVPKIDIRCLRPSMFPGQRNHRTKTTEVRCQIELLPMSIPGTAWRNQNSRFRWSINFITIFWTIIRFFLLSTLADCKTLKTCLKMKSFFKTPLASRLNCW